nr:myb-binding protein 1A-like protein [Ipomoea trifida]
MGKKRVAESGDELDNPTLENVNSEPTTNKMKKKKRKEAEPEEESNAPSTSKKSSSANPMEVKKEKRKRDKERHHEESDNAEPKPKQMAFEFKDDEKAAEDTSPSSSGAALPEFHIGVFKQLAAADSSAREAAAQMLVTELRQVQKAYDELENKESIDGELKLEADKGDGLNKCAPSLRYAVRRLIRGVSSSRECARQGFALGLSILVSAVPSIKMDSLLKLIIDLVEVTSSMKGQEVRDSLLGRLFAYGAIARSGRLTEEWIKDKDTPYIKDFIGSLVSLANKKRYLQEPAVSIIWELVEKLPVEALSNHVFEAPGLLEWFECATEVGNPDALLLALKMQEKAGVDKTFGKLLPSPYSLSSLFSADYLSSIATCLKESTFCQPRIHSVWPALVNILLPDTVLQDVDPAPVLNSTKKHKKSRKGEEDVEKNLRNFCEVILEGSLLSSSHDRKSLAFDVMLLLLPKLPANYASIVLSHKLVQCLMDVLSTRDSWLFKVAEHFMKELSEWAKHDDERKVTVIEALQKHSNGKFDTITRTKTVKNFMVEFKNESGCMCLFRSLTSMFLDEGHASEEPSDQSQTTDDNSEIGSVEDKDSNGALGFSDLLKSWVIESLPGVLKHSELDQNARFKLQKEILKFLAVQGLFSSTLGSEVTSFELQEKFKWPKSAISSALCRMCIEQLQSLLASAQKVEGSHALTSGAEANDLGSYFMHFVNTLRSIPSVSLYRSLNDDDEQAFKELQSMEALLLREERHSVSSMDLNKCHAMRYLLIQLLLQILLRPGEFSEAASELVICCKKTFGSSDLLGSSGEDESNENGAPELMDVLVDTMLSLLPQSSAPLRTAIEQTFKYFCNDITDDGLVRMLRVIKKDLKPARHQDTDTEDDDDNDLLDIEDEEEEPDEDEINETAESDEQTDGSEAVVGAEIASTELPDASDDSESDEGMDDDAMFRMDSYLARIFKEKKNQAGGETAQSQLVLFKLRVLSLLEIYLHENPGEPLVLKVFQNLAQAFINPNATEGSEQLGQRIWGILQKKIFKAKDYPRGEALQLPLLESILEKFLKLAARPFKKKKSAANLSKKKQSVSLNRYKMINSLAQNSTFWILKIVDGRNFPENELERILDIFKSVLAAYFDSKKSQMKSDFLKEIFKRRPWVGHHLFEFLLEKCSNAKLQFRQVEGLDLILETLKSLVPANADQSNQEASKKTLKGKLRKLSHLIQVLVTNMPDKQSRRADVRKFCSKVFGILSSLNLTAPFLKALEPDGHTACESQLGDTFLALKKQQ